jgi:Asp-tRNA(Asn)/Glu-tRNA(Gln) amidotransferase A subunit family amidase
VKERLDLLDAAVLADRLQRRDVTAVSVVRAFLERVDEREPVVRAWTHFDSDALLAFARELDQGAIRGPLHGFPVGVKDVFDTFDMPTAYGSPIYEGHRPRTDAASVALTRRAGGLVMGKTVTTEFATFPPGPTTNPRNPAHTPGGSSSGSAAAVGAGMVPVAFGTQTTGSIIRPASFCGVVGYKPTFGTLSPIGVKAITWSFDTVGVLVRSVADAAFFVAVLSGRDTLRMAAEPSAPRIGLCLTAQWPMALPETQALFEVLPARLAARGARVERVDLPASFDGINDAQDTIWEYEMARCLADEHRRSPHQIRERLRKQLDSGLAMPAARYDAAMRLARESRLQLDEVMGECDVLLVPSAPGEAPLGLEATGDPVFNRTWSLLHTPAIHVPAGQGPNGLPIGVQVIGRIGDDSRALACARWIERALG